MKKTMITMMVAAIAAMDGVAYFDLIVLVYAKVQIMHKFLLRTDSFEYYSYL